MTKLISKTNKKYFKLFKLSCILSSPKEEATRFDITSTL